MSNFLLFKIALRYLKGKGSINAIPILSRISIAAIAVSSCAMLVLFSVFNGFSALIDDLYKSFYPEIIIKSTQGKFFDPNTKIINEISSIKGIQVISQVVEDNVLVNTENDDYLPITLKGVDSNYFKVNELKPYIIKGNDTLISNNNLATAIIGQSILSYLGIDVDNVFSRVMVYYPQISQQSQKNNLINSFNSLLLKPNGAFAVQEEFDSKYVLVPIQSAEQLFNTGSQISSLELKILNDFSGAKIQKQLQKILGEKFSVKTRFEQNKTVYMVAKTEKWAGFLILLFVLLIASFNMVGALSLLVLEKQKDMSILCTLGLLPQDLKKVLLIEGFLWSIIGGAIGIFVGILLCLGQKYFGWIKLQGNFIIDIYPVAIQFIDILVVLITVITVGILTALYPSYKASKVNLSQGLLQN